MKKQYFILALLCALLTLFAACEKWSTSIDPLIDNVEDSRLTDENQIDFIINGLHTRFGTTLDLNAFMTGLLADEFFFDSRVPNATFPSFYDIDVGDIVPDNNSVDQSFNDLGELRFFADDLIRRVGEITFEDEALMNKALFWANFYGGVARYMYAAYYGLNPDEGGGVIDAGPFIPSADMYAQAVTKLQTALDYTTDAYNTKLVYSVLARIYIFQNNYSSAYAAAQNGLAQGDAPYQALYTTESDNYFWQQAGNGRTQMVLDNRFNQYLVDDATEAARVAVDAFAGTDGTTFYRQAKFPAADSPIDYLTWQENSLILAECALNGQAGDALALINAVRASHGLAALAAADMNVLIQERDKELMCTGVRLPDQRRWDAEYDTWHLADGKWMYLPITERERNINENF